MKKILCFSLAAILLFSTLLIFSSCDDKNDAVTEATTAPPSVEPTDEDFYNEALSLLSEGKYEEAYDIFFFKLKDYKDTADYLSKFSFKPSTVKEETEDDATVTRYEYNSQGYTTKKSELNTTENSASNSETTIEYMYDKNGNIISQTSRMPYNNSITFLYEYDENGNLTKYTRIDNGQTSFTYSYAYDANGRLGTKTTSYTDIEEVQEINKYTYNEDGSISEIKHSSSNGDSYVTMYKYDSKGRLTEVTSTRSNITYTMKYEYNSDGLLSKESYSSSKPDDYSYTSTYEYDKYGNISTKQLTASNNTLDTYTYVHDEYGNITKMTFRDIRGTKTVTQYLDFELYYNPNYDINNIP